MSEAPSLPEPTAAALARVLVRAVLVGKTPRKIAKVVRGLRRVADEMEAAEHACVGVYPINGGGQPYGQRPADLELRAAATALLAALRAELPRALSPSWGHDPRDYL